MPIKLFGAVGAITLWAAAAVVAAPADDPEHVGQRARSTGTAPVPATDSGAPSRLSPPPVAAGDRLYEPNVQRLETLHRLHDAPARRSAPEAARNRDVPPETVPGTGVGRRVPAPAAAADGGAATAVFRLAPSPAAAGDRLYTPDPQRLEELRRLNAAPARRSAPGRDASGYKP